MRLLPYGDRGLLVECDDLASAQRAHLLLAEGALHGVRELVPAGRTVLVRVDTRVLGLSHLEHWVHSVLAGAGAQPSGGAARAAGGETTGGEAVGGAAVSIRTVYDGEDLAAVAGAWGCSVDEVVARHTATEWVCAFVGFAPGFPYLVPAGADVLPAVPRRATSRATVPAGSVALAAEYCGVYPRASPGGWQLIGRTDVELWDARREPPALVTAGARVRFVPVRATVRGSVSGAVPRDVSQESSTATPGRSSLAPSIARSAPEKRHGGAPRSGDSAHLRVLEPGPLTLVHDLGRPGLAGLGVGTSGAFDRAAHRLANRLVGNLETASGLEVLLGGAAVALPAGTWIAVTGADGPVTLDDAPVALAHPARAERDGAVLRLGPATRGLRYSVAVRGGLVVDPVLGSRSRDTLAALGPEPLHAGDRIPIGTDMAGPVPAIDLVPVDARPDSVTELTVRPGPRHDWFGPDTWHDMLHAAWTVSARADRTGVRLEGSRLDRIPETVGRELASEGMIAGAIQVSPDGVPTILGPDHPVTGGYPVIGVVTDDALDRLAQLRPGDTVRLRLATGRP